MIVVRYRSLKNMVKYIWSKKYVKALEEVRQVRRIKGTPKGQWQGHLLSDISYADEPIYKSSKSCIA